MKSKPPTYKVKTIRAHHRFKSEKSALDFAKHLFSEYGRVVVVTQIAAGGIEKTIATFKK